MEKSISENGIYQIRNKINNKKYIGLTMNAFKQRWKEHLWSLRSNSHYSKYLQRAFNKYGESNFEFLIVEKINSVKKEIFQDKEIYHIKDLKSHYTEEGYNLNWGGDVIQNNHLFVYNIKNLSLFKEFESLQDAANYFNTTAKNLYNIIHLKSNPIYTQDYLLCMDFEKKDKKYLKEKLKKRNLLNQKNHIINKKIYMYNRHNLKFIKSFKSREACADYFNYSNGGVIHSFINTKSNPLRLKDFILCYNNENHQNINYLKDKVKKLKKVNPKNSNPNKKVFVYNSNNLTLFKIFQSSEKTVSYFKYKHIQHIIGCKVNPKQTRNYILCYENEDHTNKNYLNKKLEKLNKINYQKRIIVFDSNTFKQLYIFETSKKCADFFDYNIGNFQQVLRHGKNPPKLQNYIFVYETDIENKSQEEIDKILKNKLNNRTPSRIKKVYCYDNVNKELFKVFNNKAEISRYFFGKKLNEKITKLIKSKGLIRDQYILYYEDDYKNKFKVV